MPTINIHIPSSSYSRNAEGITMPDAIEAALKDKVIIEALGLGGVAGYRWHGLSVSEPVQVIDKFNGVENPRQVWKRTVCAKWQAMQTLPQEISGEQNPIKDVTIKIEHGPEFSGEPAVTWVIKDGKLVARPGRPTEITGGRDVKVYLDLDTIEHAKATGGGSISAGLRELARRDIERGVG